MGRVVWVESQEAERRRREKRQRIENKKELKRRIAQSKGRNRNMNEINTTLDDMIEYFNLEERGETDE